MDGACRLLVRGRSACRGARSSKFDPPRHQDFERAPLAMRWDKPKGGNGRTSALGSARYLHPAPASRGLLLHARTRSFAIGSAVRCDGRCQRHADQKAQSRCRCQIAEGEARKAARSPRPPRASGLVDWIIHQADSIDTPRLLAGARSRRASESGRERHDVRREQEAVIDERRLGQAPGCDNTRSL